MPTKTLMTALDFLQSVSETDGFELARGELVPMPLPGDPHGIVCANSVYLLKSYTKQIGHGVVMGNDSGIITERNPDSVRGVDVALFLHPRSEGASRRRDTRTCRPMWPWRCARQAGPGPPWLPR